MSTIENVQYKHDDYAVRSYDAYAMAKYRIILKWLPARPNLRVLNAGCGSGEMSALLAQNETWQIDAIDVDPEAIRLSYDLKQRLSLGNINLFQTDIANHTGYDYDIIVSNDVLEHLADDELALAILAKMLRPGGILAVSIPALQWLFGYHDELLGHYRRYNKRLLLARLSPHFRVEKCRYFGGTLVPLAVWYSLLRRQPYPVSKGAGTSVASRVLNTLLGVEGTIPLPWGTSLLALATASE